MKRIGDILRETCNLSEDALNQALKIQEEKNGRIGEILIEGKAITETDLLKALSIQFDMPFMSNLPIEDLQTEFTQKAPIQFLKKYKMVPVINPNEALIATHDPLLFQPLDDLKLLLGLNGIQVVLAPYSAIVSTINFAYDMSRDSAEEVIEGIERF